MQGILDAGQHARLELDEGRGAWIHVARGKVRVNGQEIGEGDGVAIEGERAVELDGVDDGEVLAFDLA